MADKVKVFRPLDLQSSQSSCMPICAAIGEVPVHHILRRIEMERWRDSHELHSMLTPCTCRHKNNESTRMEELLTINNNLNPLHLQVGRNYDADTIVKIFMIVSQRLPPSHGVHRTTLSQSPGN